MLPFGFSPSDIIGVIHLASRVIQDARMACGRLNAFSREVSSLTFTLIQLDQEAANPNCLVNRSGHHYGQELGIHIQGCREVLESMEEILLKYVGIKEGGIRSAWQKVRFGTGDKTKLEEFRSSIVQYTNGLSVILMRVSIGAMSRIESQVVDSRRDIRIILNTVNGIVARMIANDQNGSVSSTLSNDEEMAWENLRRELKELGFNSAKIQQYKERILEYFKVLLYREGSNAFSAANHDRSGCSRNPVHWR